MTVQILNFFIFILFLCSFGCAPKKPQDTLYKFPPLSVEQLTDLKEKSKNLEGFFMSTDFSDLSNTWAQRGFYIYVCIRFLNDPTVNTQLNKSAIPLLIQVSNLHDKPQAESILLLHPENLKSNTKGVIYHKEQTSFKLDDTALALDKKSYNIFNTNFNENGKITQISFLQEGTTPEELKQFLQKEKPLTTNKDIYLTMSSFAKLSSKSCTNWPRLKYTHTNTSPTYLQTTHNTETTSPTNKAPPTDTQNNKSKLKKNQ